MAFLEIDGLTIPERGRTAASQAKIDGAMADGRMLLGEMQAAVPLDTGGVGAFLGKALRREQQTAKAEYTSAGSEVGGSERMHIWLGRAAASTEIAIFGQEVTNEAPVGTNPNIAVPEGDPVKLVETDGTDVLFLTRVSEDRHMMLPIGVLQHMLSPSELSEKVADARAAVKLIMEADSANAASAVLEETAPAGAGVMNPGTNV